MTEEVVTDAQNDAQRIQNDVYAEILEKNHTARGIADALTLSLPQVRKALKALIAEGAVAKTGRKRGMKYYLSGTEPEEDRKVFAAAGDFTLPGHDPGDVIGQVFMYHDPEDAIGHDESEDSEQA